MKKVIFLIISVLVFNLGYASDESAVAHKPKASKITEQIYDMLAENPIPNEIRGAKAEVRVAVDDGNYLRILSVETDNKAFDSYIRTTIDFRKLTRGTYEKGIVYRIPIEVKE